MENVFPGEWIYASVGTRHAVSLPQIQCCSESWNRLTVDNVIGVTGSGRPSSVCADTVDSVMTIFNSFQPSSFVTKM